MSLNGRTWIELAETLSLKPLLIKVTIQLPDRWGHKHKRDRLVKQLIGLDASGAQISLNTCSGDELQALSVSTLPTRPGTPQLPQEVQTQLHQDVTGTRTPHGIETRPRVWTSWPHTEPAPLALLSTRTARGEQRLQIHLCLEIKEAVPGDGGASRAGEVSSASGSWLQGVFSLWKNNWAVLWW